MNGGAYAIEIIRGGVESIPNGQTEAGLALGLHKHEVFRLIVLKPALRAIYPSLSSQFILLTLTTAICTSISAYELTSVGQRIVADTFRSFEVHFTLTGIYLVISLIMMWLLSAMTMICVTHEMGFARQVADRVIFMAEGQIIEENATEAFFSSPKHERTRAFLGEILPRY